MHAPLWAGIFWESVNGRMALHAMPLLLGALCILAIFYRYYSAFLASRVWALDNSRPTPAHTLNDGQNYHPTNRWVLFGHHFAAISGAGPLIGPVLALQYGYMVPLVWLVIGVCLAGAVQDMLVLAASVRRGGKSLAEIARTELGSRAYLVVSAAILFIVIIALAGLGVVVVKALGGEEVALTKQATITMPAGADLTIAENLSGPTAPVYAFPEGCSIRYAKEEKPIHRPEGFFIKVPADQPMRLIDGVVNLPEGSSQLVKGSSWGVFTIACTIPIALFVGWWMYVLRKGRVLEASLIGAALVIAATIYGANIPGSTWEGYFSLTKDQTVLALVGYGFVASVLPVWLLLCPRDYLSSFLKIGTIILLIVGVVLANPVLYQPMYNPIFEQGGPTFQGAIFPFVFICIMCGAISGFHALVSSGTTPKMIDRESDIRPIGYGAMLLEGIVGIVALVAAASLDPKIYYDINVPLQQQTSNQALQKDLDKLYKEFSLATGPDVAHLPVENTRTDLAAIEKRVGNEALRGRTGGAVTLAVGMADVLSDASRWVVDPKVVEGLFSYWYHFAIMFEALFILTTIDTGTRIARFLLQEAMGKIVPAWEKPDHLPASLIATALVVAGWGLLIQTGSIATIWPMFGIANQLLAVLALALVTTLLVNTGRGKWAWLTILPMLFVVATTMTAAQTMVLVQFPARIQAGQVLTGTLSLVMTIVVVALVVTLLLLAVSRWVLVMTGKVPIRQEAT